VAACDRPSVANAAQSRYHGTSRMAAPSTTKRGSRASPMKSCSREMPMAGAATATIAPVRAAFGERGSSGRPMP
jgi:hypothetical protein